MCEAPLDMMCRKDRTYEMKLLDQFIERTGISFENNVSRYKFFGHKVKRVCVCCFESNIYYNPQLHTARQCGLVKLTRQQKGAVSYLELENWVRDLHTFIVENKPK
jgi:hypothetical protein